MNLYNYYLDTEVELKEFEIELMGNWYMMDLTVIANSVIEPHFEVYEFWGMEIKKDYDAIINDFDIVNVSWIDDEPSKEIIDAFYAEILKSQEIRDKIITLMMENLDETFD